jgi:hypothetical protein
MVTAVAMLEALAAAKKAQAPMVAAARPPPLRPLFNKTVTTALKSALLTGKSLFTTAILSV